MIDLPSIAYLDGFALGRDAERARIVAWLRERQAAYSEMDLQLLIDDLERPRCTSCHGVGFWVETHLGGRREVHPCGH